MKRLVLVALLACSNDGKSAPEPPPPPEPTSELEQRLVELAECELVGARVDLRCPAGDRLRQAQHALDKATEGAELARVGRKFLAHPAPAVRVQAAELLGVYGRFADPTALDTIVEAARTERDPLVVAGMVQAAGGEAGSNAKVADLVRWAADHEHAEVRRVALTTLVLPRHRALGGAAKVAAMMTADPDQHVRDTACRFAGALGDDALVPAYEQATERPAWGCMEGLLQMWARPPDYDTSSEAAFRLTVQRLAEGKGASLADRLDTIAADDKAPELTRKRAAEARAAIKK